VQAKRTNEQILHSEYDPLQISVDERMSLMENTLNQLKQGGAAIAATANAAAVAAGVSNPLGAPTAPYANPYGSMAPPPAYQPPRYRAPPPAYPMMHNPIMGTMGMGMPGTFACRWRWTRTATFWHDEAHLLRSSSNMDPLRVKKG